MPRSATSVEAALPESWMAATRRQAELAFDRCLVTYEAKYPKATECLARDRAALPACYDFPAERWVPLRTTNPIESAFATMRHRSDRAKGCVTRATMLALMFKLALAAEQSFRKLTGLVLLATIIAGVRFVDGVGEIEGQSLHQAPQLTH